MVRMIRKGVIDQTSNVEELEKENLIATLDGLL